MVQTVYHWDSYSKSRYKSTMKQHVEKHISEKAVTLNTYIEPTKQKGKKNDCVKLQPLNANSGNDIYVSNERKFSHRLNLCSGKLGTPTEQKKPSSKIPVLKRKAMFNPKQTNIDVHWDTSLSAADRRQKFHQSRICAAGNCAKDTTLVTKKLQTPLQYDLLSWYEGYDAHNIAPPLVPVNQKSILPPIKPVDTSVRAEPQTSQPKEKCLLGEITHFPALCNPLCSKRRKNFVSTVPHLPPILPPPAAPPPSISTSLEKDGNQVKQKTLNIKKDEWLYIQLA